MPYQKWSSTRKPRLSSVIRCGNGEWCMLHYSRASLRVSNAHSFRPPPKCSVCSFRSCAIASCARVVHDMHWYFHFHFDVHRVLTWFLAASPIKRSVSLNATYDGVVRLPWSFAMISTFPCCQTPTQEYVVPKSIPIAGAIVSCYSFVFLCKYQEYSNLSTKWTTAQFHHRRKLWLKIFQTVLQWMQTNNKKLLLFVPNQIAIAQQIMLNYWIFQIKTTSSQMLHLLFFNWIDKKCTNNPIVLIAFLRKKNCCFVTVYANCAPCIHR